MKYETTHQDHKIGLQDFAELLQVEHEMMGRLMAVHLVSQLHYPFLAENQTNKMK